MLQPQILATGPAEIISDFLGVRGLTQATGDPLYTYRCDSNEFARLEKSLARRLAGPQVRTACPVTSQAFCLWAAEWWRRNHNGGHWRWENLLASIHCEHLAPGNPGYSELCKMVSRGLERWGRDLIRLGDNRRAFLVTIVCEGGLPLKLVLHEQTSLRRYFKALLKEFRSLGQSGMPSERMAERVAQYLPTSLQQDTVYRLSGQLIAEIWRLQSIVGETPNPILELDRVDPGWRRNLPLEVSDQVARTLLNGLLLEAATLARGDQSQIRYRRALEVSGSVKRLVGIPELPKSLQLEAFAYLFGVDKGEVPRRFDLSFEVEQDRPEVLAIGTTRRSADAGTYLGLEHTRRVGRPVSGRTVSEPRILLVRDGQQSRRSDQFTGASALSDLPWVFGKADEDTGHHPIVGEGSVKTRESHAFVVVRGDAEVVARPGAVVEQIGALDDFDRQILRISGTLEVNDTNGRCVVQTGAPADTVEFEYRLRGRKRFLGRRKNIVYFGPPDLIQRDDGGSSRRIQQPRLEWKPEHPSGRWQHYTMDAVGDGRLRYTEDGAVKYSTQLTILPRDAEIRYVPGRSSCEGTIELVGSAAKAVWVTDPRVRATTRSSGPRRHAVSLSCVGHPPLTIQLHVEWDGDQEMRLEVPFPTTGAGFRRVSGALVPADGTASVRDLAGIQAFAMVPEARSDFQLYGRYRGADAVEIDAYRTGFSVPLREETSGLFETDIGNLQTRISSHLNFSDDPDGYVRLDIMGSGTSDITQRPLRIGRFDMSLEIDLEESLVRISTHELPQIEPTSLDNLQVEAFPLLHPDTEPVRLDRSGGAAWLLPPGVTTGGPWMIVGWDGDWCRLGPCTWNPAPSVSPPIPEEAHSLAEAYAFEDFGRRAKALSAVIEQMATDPSHHDWNVVDSIISWTKDLPAVCFEILRALCGNHEAAALAALRSPEDDFYQLWGALETLPFWWHVVPQQSWKNALSTYIRGFEAGFSGIDAELRAQLRPEAVITDSVRGAIARIAGEIGSLEPMLEFALSSIMGRQVGSQFSRVVRPDFSQILLQDRASAFSEAIELKGDLRRLPTPDFIHEMIDVFRDIPEVQGLWIGLNRDGGSQKRFELANAPVVAALCALTGQELSRKQLFQLRTAAQYTPEWFGQAYHLTYIAAFGATLSANIP